MAPQFVDFNGDGHTDIFTATFDGSPHVALGSSEGYQAPQRVLDVHGERVLLTQFWNYDTEKWDDTDRTIENNTLGQLHCVSAVAFDWDNDGDYDVLMGDKNRGRLFLQMNEGTNAEPAFTGKNIPVLAGSLPIEMDGGMTAPYLVDWDADGLMDIVCGSFGDSYGDQKGGGVSLFRNVGSVGSPEFAAPVTLVTPSLKGSSVPNRPDSGLYVDVVDYNGDGALDLLVGGYSHWKPEPKPLTDDEQKHVAELEAEQARCIEELRGMSTKLQEETSELPPEERQKKVEALTSTEEYQTLLKRYSKVRSELMAVKPETGREAFVWLYLRK